MRQDVLRSIFNHNLAAMKKDLFCLFLGMAVCTGILSAQENAWIRINQLGYTPSGTKVAV